MRSDSAAMVGIGETDFHSRAQRSELRLAVEAVVAACADAGIHPREIDGMCTVSTDGVLPTNTSGGQIGEAYVNGMNQIVEAVRQVRGTSVNQVDDVEISFVSSGNGAPPSALLPGRGP